MKPEMKSQWTNEDFELHEAFEEVSEAYRSERGPAPRVPSALDRRIREQARYHIGAELSENWIFSKAPQLAVAAILLFSIGIYFVVAVDNQAPVTGGRDAPIFDDRSGHEDAPAMPQRLDDNKARQLEHERLEEAAPRSAEQYRLTAPQQGIPDDQPGMAEKTLPVLPPMVEQADLIGSDACNTVTFAFTTDNVGRPVDPRVLAGTWCLERLAALDDAAERASYQDAIIARARDQLMQLRLAPNTEMRYQITIPPGRDEQE